MHGHFIFPNVPLEMRSNPYNLRHVHPSTLLMPSFRTNAHQFSFFPHTISIWNSLPASTHSLDTACYLFIKVVMSLSLCPVLVRFFCIVRVHPH